MKDTVAQQKPSATTLRYFRSKATGGMHNEDIAIGLPLGSNLITILVVLLNVHI